MKIPPAPDAGPVVPVVVRQGVGGPRAARIALVDVAGLIVRQNQSGVLSVGENPVSRFREEARGACSRPQGPHTSVLRIQQPGRRCRRLAIQWPRSFAVSA